MNTTEHAAEIRATLKKQHRWNSRQVSVRAEYFSLGSSISVEIKDPAIPLPVVKEIAERAERIHRCEITGEILGGGNRYISVRYSREASKIIGRRYAGAVQNALNGLEAGSNALNPIAGTPFFLGLPYPGRLALWEDRHLTDAYTVDILAETIGELMIAREAA